jgi:hypothetical protein
MTSCENGGVHFFSRLAKTGSAKDGDGLKKTKILKNFEKLILPMEIFRSSTMDKKI